MATKKPQRGRPVTLKASEHRRGRSVSLNDAEHAEFLRRGGSAYLQELLYPAGSQWTNKDVARLRDMVKAAPTPMKINIITRRNPK